MAIPRILERARELIAVELAGMTPTLQHRFDAIKAKNTAAGLLHSGATLKALQEAAEADLSERSNIILESFKRTYAAFMPAAIALSREKGKQFALEVLAEQTAAVAPQLDKALRTISNEQTIQRAKLGIAKPSELIPRKLAVEVDLYFDHIDSSRGN